MNRVLPTSSGASGHFWRGSDGQRLHHGQGRQYGSEFGCSCRPNSRLSNDRRDLQPCFPPANSGRIWTISAPRSNLIGGAVQRFPTPSTYGPASPNPVGRFACELHVTRFRLPTCNNQPKSLSLVIQKGGVICKPPSKRSPCAHPGSELTTFSTPIMD